jgi:hypothetical protein
MTVVNNKGLLMFKPLIIYSDPDWIQTNDLLLRRQLLYSAELPDRLSILSAGPQI